MFMETKMFDSPSEEKAKVSPTDVLYTLRAAPLVIFQKHLVDIIKHYIKWIILAATLSHGGCHLNSPC